ncbi:class I SAM-dependent methyltransferase [Mycobacterium sp. 1423905.2]|uniref:class I SAM-dependent methyltransferase n=1 Tax=Mycobacterium sp. 1423905.2 TaxID=1856859 RepID=UPI0007FEFCF3|nr:class I SAM-dependent methyltransferase [Mycobacterium sp. 1423905.2]OBJ50677.1 SAM-dependent methyltransferase [Mycobacterium sp. 1423905.2]
MMRRDDDSWDLTSHVGATATLVAAGRARATNSAQPLIEDRFAEPLVRAVGIEFLIRWASGDLCASDVDEPEAAWGLQRMTTELVARTRYFDQFFADATAAGIRQAVILASGLDARGYRLPWPPGTTVYEIDQPHVLQFKAETLAQLGAESTAHLRMVPADLRHDWPAALLRSGFDPALPTAWIAEGLFGYLPPEAQDRLLDNVTKLSAPASRMAMETFVGSSDSGRVEEIIRSATRNWREHGFDLDIWSLNYSGARSEAPEYLANHGWRSVGTTSAQLLADHRVAAMPGHYVAPSDKPSYYTSVLA